MDENTDPIMGGFTPPPEGDGVALGQGNVEDGFRHESPPAFNNSKPATIPSISERLSQQEEQNTRADSEVMTAEEPFQFDLTKLRPEQLQQLKQMLAVTPDRIVRKKVRPTIKLPLVNDKPVIDYHKAYKGLVDDPENHRKVEKTLIQVLCYGETEFRTIRYSEFINADKVVCEVLSTRSDPEEYVEGQTISRETGQLVEMVVKIPRDWFTVKLPDGSSVEIESKLANA